ncbi:MAG: hypothetical protein ABJ251_16075 [Paracoccaceae bacterium]
MKRICFVGNSHVGAVKQAIDDLSDDSSLNGFEFSTFACQSRNLETVQVNNGVLSSDDEKLKESFIWTSGGSSEVVIADYDVICFLMGRSMFDYKMFRSGSDIPYLSVGLFDEIMAGAWNSWQMQLVENTARANKNVQVVHIGHPFVSVASPKIKSFLDSLCDSDSGLYDRAKSVKARIEEKASAISVGNLRVMAPPPAALDETGFFTQHTFCQGSKGSNRITETEVEHSSDDFAHMNEVYGRMLIDHLLAELA